MAKLGRRGLVAPQRRGAIIAFALHSLPVLAPSTPRRVSQGQRQTPACVSRRRRRRFALEALSGMRAWIERLSFFYRFCARGAKLLPMKGKRVKSTTVGQRDACSGCDGRFHAALRMGGRNDRGHLSIDAGSCGCAAARGPGSPARPFLRGGKRLLQHPVHCAPPRSCAANARSIRMEFLFFGGANRFPRAPCRQAVQGKTGAHPAQSGVAPSPNDIERRGGAFSGRGKRIRSGEARGKRGEQGETGLGESKGGIRP